MINLFISQYFVTNKRLELLPRTDFGKIEEKTDLLTKEVGDLRDSQLRSIQLGLLSAGVEFSDITALPTFAIRQFLPFT